jgi:hypothetical protein
MPVNIYRVTSDDKPNEAVAWLCDGDWLISSQVDALAEWLNRDGSGLPKGKYVADIGFCWRRDASAGGPVLDVATMRRMVDIGMDLFLSEYSGFADEGNSAEPDGPANGHQPARRVAMRTSRVAGPRR